MNKLPLADCLKAYAADYERHGVFGMILTPSACMVLATMMRHLATRAGELEAAERTLAQMEAVARDIEMADAAAPHLSRMRVAVATETMPGTNVVPWPIVPRPAPGGGDAA